MKDKSPGTVSNWNCVIVSAVLFAILALMVIYFPNIREYDSAVLSWIQKLWSPYPEIVPFVLNEIGKNYYVWPLFASGSVLISHKMYLKAFLLVFFTELAHVLIDLIKNIICRERPCGDSYPGFSFPSGHSVTAMCFYGILIYLVIRHTSGFWKYFLVTLFAFMIVLSGLSRLWLGVHFPIDVTAGMLMGFVLVNLYIILCKWFNA